MSLTVAESAAVIGDLRRARRRQRVAAIHWVDALYQVYVTGIVAVVVVVLLSGLVGDDKVHGAALDDVTRVGPALLGLIAALAVFLGLRSGSRGGPLALEQPDVRHVLLAPVDRGVALRGPAWRQLRFLAFAGAGVGAAAGQLALRRLPGNGALWIVCGAAFAVVVAGLGFGCALVASGAKLPRWAATLIGLVLVAWSVAEVAGKVSFAPATVVGHLGTYPLDHDLLSLVGIPLAVGAVALGMVLVAGTSLEAAERRTALVGQLRFAVTLQDLRTVLVLRRQLAQEVPRSKPWLPTLGRPARYPVWKRGVRSLARWPITRLVRVLILATVAGLALRGAWNGTTPLLLLAGLALWVAALDAVEPLGQEIDHPGRTDGYPMVRGELFVAHLPIVGLVAGLSGLVAGAVAAAPVGAAMPADVALLVGLLGGLLAGCGAVVSVIQGAPDAVDVLAMTTPEIAGMRSVIRAAWPPGLAVIGTLALLPARSAAFDTPAREAMGATAPVVFLLATLLGLVGGWVRFHDEIHAALREVAEQMSPTKAIERAQAEREELEANRPGPLVPVLPDDEVGEPDPDDAPAKAAPRPKPKPTAAPAKPGVQGGSSPKPIGRRRNNG